ncbi:hypothetical protein LCGC14_1885560 [marine sediment metagenome]|uniref:Uncharacterized protein n=1 Tax=marine sediment metagenome TaxID=412755 RepID=A0A0F9EW96_9ZZZZ
MKYTAGMVREVLSNYQSRAQDARQRPPEDRLGTRAPPLEEAPWANTSCLWSDIEQAMRALPFNWEKIVFAELCLGGGREELSTGWRNGMSRHNWREKVGDFWGITGGAVKRIVDEAIQEMCKSLNGAEFVDGENDAETVNEYDPQSALGVPREVA